jgi:hypothetical protein
MSISTLPLNSPWTESLVNNAARLVIESGVTLLVTIALNRNCWPFPACLINSLAANLPILPKPYKITSLGVMLWSSELLKFPNLSFKNSAWVAKFSFSRFHSCANFPISNFEGAIFNLIISLANAEVSSILTGIEEIDLAFLCSF